MGWDGNTRRTVLQLQLDASISRLLPRVLRCILRNNYSGPRNTTTSNASEAARTRPGTYRYEYMAHVDGLDELVSMCEGVSCTRRRTAFLVIPHKPQPCQRQTDVLGLVGGFAF
jgi:hypothetical protein